MMEVSNAILILQQAMEMNGMSGKFELHIYLDDFHKIKNVVNCWSRYETIEPEKVSIYGHTIKPLDGYSNEL